VLTALATAVSGVLFSLEGRGGAAASRVFDLKHWLVLSMVPGPPRVSVSPRQAAHAPSARLT
jgi:hypothetical protein